MCLASKSTAESRCRSEIPPGARWRAAIAAATSTWVISATIMLCVRLTFFLNRFLKQVDGIDGPAAHVAVATMGPLSVVVHQPGVQVSLQGGHRVIERLAQGQVEELLLDGADEALDEAVGLMLGGED